MLYFHLVYGDQESQRTQTANHNRLDPITKVQDLETAEALFAAQYITEKIQKVSKFLHDGISEDVTEEIQTELNALIRDYTRSPREFLASNHLHVITIDSL